MPPLARNLVETSTREPLGEMPEERQEVDGKETRRKKDVELVGGLIGDAN